MLWQIRSLLGVFPILAAAWVLVSPIAFAGPRQVLNLDGPWAFRMDPANAGEAEQWYANTVSFPDTILVPGAWEAQGFGDETEKLHHHFIGKGWYKRQVEIPADWAGRRVSLCIGGVHRYGSVWVNGKSFGEHVDASPLSDTTSPTA